jgi:hypothetical protein
LNDKKFIWNSVTSSIYIIKEFVQPKMSLNKEFINWKEQGRGVRERERERERERVGGGSAGSHI